MKFKITNSKTKDSRNLHVLPNAMRMSPRKKALDEDPSEKETKKEEEISEKEKQAKEDPSEKETKDERIEMTEEQAEALKELIGLLPELKKLVEGDSEKKESKEKEKKEKSDEDEESEEDETGDSLFKETKGSEDIIFENSDNDIELDEKEKDFEEEEVIEDEGGNGISDSIPNPGVIEKTSNGNKDNVSREIEIANAWSERYNSLLNQK